MKILKIVLAVLFVTFAVLQLNDPDPVLWVLLYTLIAVLCLMAAFGKYSGNLIAAGLLACVIWMLALVPEIINWIQIGMPNIVESMKAESPHVEFTREFLGLLVAAATLLFLLRNQKKLEQN